MGSGWSRQGSDRSLDSWGREIGIFRIISESHIFKVVCLCFIEHVMTWYSSLGAESMSLADLLFRSWHHSQSPLPSVIYSVDLVPTSPDLWWTGPDIRAMYLSYPLAITYVIIHQWPFLHTYIPSSNIAATYGIQVLTTSSSCIKDLNSTPQPSITRWPSSFRLF